MPLLLLLRELNNAALYWTGEPMAVGVATAVIETGDEE